MPRKANHERSDAELVEASRAGDSYAFELLFERYRPLVKRRASVARGSFCAYEDLIQEGMVGLFKAVQLYDAARGSAFAAFAEQLIEHQISDALRKSRRLKHRILSDALPLQALDEDERHLQGGDFPSSENLLEQLIDWEDERQLNEKLRSLLSEREARTLFLRLRGYGYEQIAELSGLERKQIDNCLQRAKRKIRAAGFLV